MAARASSTSPRLKRRRLSPDDAGQGDGAGPSGHAGAASSMDGALSDEVLLAVFSNLAAVDLTRLQSVSKRINRLAQDPQLWKRLFYNAFVQTSSIPTLSGLRALLSSDPLASRSIRGLPPRYYSARQDVKGKAKAVDDDDDDVRHDGLDWQSLYRVSANWQSGNFAVTELLRQGIQKGEQGDLAASGPDRPQTLVQSAGNLIFTASRGKVARDSGGEGGETVVRVYMDAASGEKEARHDVEHPHDPTKNRPVALLRSRHLAASPATITELKVDASSTIPSIKLFVAYSNLAWSIFEITASSPNSLDYHEVLSHSPPPNTPTSSSPVVLSSLSWPLLATCTADFNISIYNVCEGQARLLKEMHSQTCHWPATISLAPLTVVGPRSKLGKRRRSRATLSAQTTSSIFRFTVAYCSPAYPRGWTLSLQEILLDSRDGCVVSSRFATACGRPTSTSSHGRRPASSQAPSSPSSDDEADDLGAQPTSPPRSTIFQALPRPTSPPPINTIKSITYDDPYLVVGSEDNMLEVYELQGAVQSTEEMGTVPRLDRPLRLLHRRILYGHMGSVLSVALEDGRCVSGSSDGSVMVWTLGDSRQRRRRSERRTPMEHVVTLRSRDEAVAAAAPAKSSLIPTLSDLLTRVRKEAAATVGSGTRPAVIKWVSTAYDRVLSILGKEDEQVQVWSFAG